MAVFSGGWTLELCEQVCADERLDEVEILDLLGRLVDKSLVSVKQDEQDTHYRMLETIRQYAHEKLFESGEATALRDRHLARFLELAERAEPEVRGPDQITWLDRLDAELDNLRAALEWAQDRNAEVFLRLASALWRFWDNRFYGPEGSAWLLKAFELNQEMYSTARAKALARASILLRNLNDFYRAFQIAQAAVELGETLQDIPAIALAYYALHMAALANSQESFILSSQEKCLALSRELGDHWLVGGILSEYCLDPYDPEKQLATRIESVREARLSGDRRLIGFCLAEAGFTALVQGDSILARDFFKEGLSLAYQLRDKLAIAYRSINMSYWAVYVEDHSQAEQLSAEALQIIREIGSPLLIEGALISCSLVAWAAGKIDLLSAFIMDAIEIASRQEENDVNAWLISYFQGNIAHVNENRDAAKACFRKALEMATVKNLFALDVCFGGLACLSADQDQLERAVRLFAANEKTVSLQGIINFPCWPNFPFLMRMHQQRLDKILTCLDREVYEALWAQGKAMSPAEAYAYAFLEGD